MAASIGQHTQGAVLCPMSFCKHLPPSAEAAAAAIDLLQAMDARYCTLLKGFQYRYSRRVTLRRECYTSISAMQALCH